jgi:hypothetical protein
VVPVVPRLPALIPRLFHAAFHAAFSQHFYHNDPTPLTIEHYVTGFAKLRETMKDMPVRVQFVIPASD